MFDVVKFCVATAHLLLLYCPTEMCDLYERGVAVRCVRSLSAQSQF